uniref:(northern house mosquito) hypothetical protein n=1 Tax=Culex pipiens TaxID=7175 RepID=A0A8D8K721_CULPI
MPRVGLCGVCWVFEQGVRGGSAVAGVGWEEWTGCDRSVGHYPRGEDHGGAQAGQGLSGAETRVRAVCVGQQRRSHVLWGVRVAAERSHRPADRHQLDRNDEDDQGVPSAASTVSSSAHQRY